MTSVKPIIATAAVLALSGSLLAETPRDMFLHVAHLSASGMAEGVQRADSRVSLSSHYRDTSRQIISMVHKAERAKGSLLDEGEARATILNGILQLRECRFEEHSNGKEAALYLYLPGSSGSVAVYCGSSVLAWLHTVEADLAASTLSDGSLFDVYTTGGDCTGDATCTSAADCTTKSCTASTCTSQSLCTSQADCTSSTQHCTNGSSCTGGDGCTASDSSCTDGSECTNGDSCTKGTSCTGGPNSGCTKGNSCTANNVACTSNVGSCTGGGLGTPACTTGAYCTANNTSCTMGNVCTSNGSCTAASFGCTSGSGCTLGTNCTYGSHCTGGFCTTGTCTHAQANCTKGTNCTKGPVCSSSPGGMRTDQGIALCWRSGLSSLALLVGAFLIRPQARGVSRM